jgi:hypothetical protein
MQQFFFWRSSLQRLNSLIYNLYLNVYSNISFLNFNIFMFLTYLAYNFYFIVSDGFGIFILSLLLSFLITDYILNNFKFSDNSIVRFLQKNILYFILFIICILLFYIIIKVLHSFINIIECSGQESGTIRRIENNNSVTSNPSNKGKDVVSVTEGNDKNNEYYEFKVKKDVMHKFGSGIMESSKIAVEKIAPNSAAGIAAGALGSSVFKATSGLPPVTRMGAVAGSMMVGAAATKLGVDIATTISNKNEAKKLKKVTETKHSDHDKDQIPSPDDLIITSPLEHGEIISLNDSSPLADMLIHIFSLNVLILILIIIFLFLIFNRFILKSNSEFIKSFVDKYMPKKIKVWTEQNFHNKVDKVIDYNNRFMLIMFIVNSITLIAMVLLNIYASSELVNNIDEYVEIHNFLNNNNKSILLIISFIPKNYKVYYNMRKNNWTSLDKYNKGINTSPIQNNSKINDIESVDNYYKEVKDKNK